VNDIDILYGIVLYWFSYFHIVNYFKVKTIDEFLDTVLLMHYKCGSKRYYLLHTSLPEGLQA